MKQQIIDNNYNYPELLEALLKISNKFSFVMRSNFKITESERNIFNLFEKYLLLETEVKAWPGTELLYGKKARIYYYSFNKETCDFLKKQVIAFMSGYILKNLKIYVFIIMKYLFLLQFHMSMIVILYAGRRKGDTGECIPFNETEKRLFPSLQQFHLK